MLRRGRGASYGLTISRQAIGDRVSGASSCVVPIGLLVVTCGLRPRRLEEGRRAVWQEIYTDARRQHIGRTCVRRGCYYWSARPSSGYASPLFGHPYRSSLEITLML